MSRPLTTDNQTLGQQRICLQRRRPEFSPWVGKIPGEGNDCPLQYSCLEDSTDRGAWQTTVHGVAEELDPAEGITAQGAAA